MYAFLLVLFLLLVGLTLYCSLIRPLYFAGLCALYLVVKDESQPTLSELLQPVENIVNGNLATELTTQESDYLTTFKN